MYEDDMIYCVIINDSPEIIVYSDQERLARWYVKFKKYKEGEYRIQKVRYPDLVTLCNRHGYVMDEIDEYKNTPITDGEMEIVSESLEQEIWYLRNNLEKIKKSLKFFKSPKIKKLIKSIDGVLRPSLDDLSDRADLVDPDDQDDILWNFLFENIKFRKYARKMLR